MLSRQKLAIAGFAVAAALVILGCWGMSGGSPRVKDVAAIFGGGFISGLAAVRFIKHWRSASTSPAPEAAAEPPARTKS